MITYYELVQVEKRTVDEATEVEGQLADTEVAEPDRDSVRPALSVRVLLELARMHKPPTAVMEVAVAAHLLLGGEESWPAARRRLRRSYRMQREVAALDPAALPQAQIDAARTLLAKEPVEGIRAVSVAAAALASSCTALLDAAGEGYVLLPTDQLEAAAQAETCCA